MGLDLSKKHSICYGVSQIKYYQDGRYYDGAGHECVISKDGQIERVKTEKPKAPSSPNGDEGGEGAGEADLKAMKTFAVKSVFVEAGGPAELSSGKGAKQRMIDWLLANA